MTSTTKFVLMAQPSAPAIPHPDVLETWATELCAEFDGLEVVIAVTDEEILEQLIDADAAYGVLPKGWHAPRLRWLQAPMANPPLGYFTPEIANHPVVVTNMRGVYNDHIATHVMAFLLAFARGLPHYAHHQRNREYRRGVAPVLHLADSTVLFIGAGGVAHQAARYLQPWGPRIVAVDARPETAACSPANHSSTSSPTRSSVSDRRLRKLQLPSAARPVLRLECSVSNALYSACRDPR